MAPSPFDGKLTAEQRTELMAFLCDELLRADEARQGQLSEVNYHWALYEQGRTRLGTLPWADAADLTSPLGTMYVDALHARAMQTIFVEPVCVVEGWGEAADRAPYVEAFHEWKQEEERLQSYIDQALHRSWIEPAGVLEISEATTVRVVRTRLTAAIQTVDGAMVIDKDGKPALRTGPDGKYIPVTRDASGQVTEPGIEIDVDSPERVRLGPEYQVIPYRDFLTLPSHASDKAQVWGFAKRFWRRVPDLTEAVKAHVYDSEAVEALGTASERQERDNPQAPAGATLVGQEGPTAEKELWEVLCLRDFGKGQRWYLATVSILHRQILRVQYDDIGAMRFAQFIPFPRSARVDGYSLVGHKLITAIEEHTAYRNMAADNAARFSNAPIKRVQGALWDPDEQPIGPGEVITVRDPAEISVMEMPDLSGPALQQIRAVEAMAERLIGQNDVSLGATPTEDRTLGERQLVAQYTEVRMNLIVRRLQETVEQVYQIRHAIWKRTLQEQPEGVQAPKSALIGLDMKQDPVGEFNGHFTAAMLEGQFRFKPRGSTETADLSKQRQDFTQFVAFLPGLLKAVPSLQMLLQKPEAARAMWEHVLRIFKVPDRQAFLGSDTTAALQLFQPPAPAPAAVPGMPPGMLGMPPGGAPPPVPMGAVA